VILSVDQPPVHHLATLTDKPFDDLGWVFETKGGECRGEGVYTMAKEHVYGEVNNESDLKRRSLRSQSNLRPTS
jgi:hypothetical protein